MSMMPIPALNAAVGGIQKQGERVAKAADDINKAFAAAQNALSADSVSVSDRAAVVPAVEDAMHGAALPPAGDVAKAVVDLLQAATAMKANMASFRVASDVAQDTIAMVGKQK